jgi:hypothetical protein
MPDSRNEPPDQLAPSDPPETPQSEQYTIRRKGSVYNIFGPQGRVFAKYKSASVVGPRWEELTHTPWPYRSSAYESGTRLWELGLIDRADVGRRDVKPDLSPDAPDTPDEASPDAMPPRVPEAEPEVDTESVPAPRPKLNLPLTAPPLALPAPRIDVAQQERMLRRLRARPVLLFDPAMRQVLQDEVTYHRRYARWASHLLGLLDRYEARRQRQARQESRSVVPSPQTILRKHLAWQSQRLAETATQA